MSELLKVTIDDEITGHVVFINLIKGVISNIKAGDVDIKALFMDGNIVGPCIRILATQNGTELYNGEVPFTPGTAKEVFIHKNVKMIHKTPLELVSERMYFIEEVTDLFVGEYITKERYLQLRSLFKTEERAFAIKIVKQLHDEHILRNIPTETLYEKG